MTNGNTELDQMKVRVCLCLYCDVMFLLCCPERSIESIAKGAGNHRK